MNRSVFVVATLVAVCGAAHLPILNSSVIVGNDVYIEPIDGAPVPPTSRIFNGSPASRGQFPYQAAILIDSKSFCGGSLISRKTVLTAAHCVDGGSKFTVHLGTIDWTVSESGSRKINTRKKVQHKNFNKRTLNNDVAIIKLGKKITLTENIRPINLASGDYSYNGVVARISGWGKTRDADAGATNRLRYADLSIMPNEVCRTIYGSAVVIDSVMCAVGANLQSVCNGDSGGPLVYQDVQIGIVSFGSADSCEKGQPDGFTRVTSFRNWINKNFATKMSLSINMMLGSSILLIAGRLKLAVM